MGGTELSTFCDYLKRLPSDIVFERIIKQSSMPRRIISSTMIKEIAAHFSTEKNLVEIFSGLSPESRIKCSLTYFFNAPRLPFDGAGLDDELVASFLVYAGNNGQGMYYAGFREFEQPLKKLFCQTLVQAAQVKPEREAQVTSLHYSIKDVAVLIALASQGKLVKTKSGEMSKSSDLCIKKLLHGAQSIFNTGIPGLSPVELALHYAQQRGILCLRGDTFILSHERALEWFEEPLETRCSEITEAAFSLFGLCRKSLVEEMLPQPGEPWLSTALLADDVKNEFCATIKMLAYCGLICFYRSGTDLVFTRSKQCCEYKDSSFEKRTERHIILQPDFSAILPQETTAESVYWFSKIGRLDFLDKVYKGTIDREIICNSLSLGIDGEELLKRLVMWHAPANVMENVREWIREFFRLFIFNGHIIASDSEKVTRQLLSYGQLADCIEPILADRIFRIKSGKENKTAEIIASMGFDSRPPWPDKTVKDDDMVCECAGKETAFMPEFRPVVDFKKNEPPLHIPVKKGKYSHQLKSLELTDRIHVIDYALLMGTRLRIEYAGSPLIRKGLYIIRPLRLVKGAQTFIEVESGKKNIKKSFLLNNIKKIGIEPGND